MIAGSWDSKRYTKIDSSGPPTSPIRNSDRRNIRPKNSSADVAPAKAQWLRLDEYRLGHHVHRNLQCDTIYTKQIRCVQMIVRVPGGPITLHGFDL